MIERGDPMKVLCIYHGACADGWFGAAWAVRKALGDSVEFHAGVYGEAPPDVTGRDVVLVDFSYKRPVLMEMAAKAHSVLVLDHHKTAAEDLAGFPAPIANGWQARLGDVEWCHPDMQPRVLFDMAKSGAVLAWEFFHPGQPAPLLLQHVQDRDLWRFALPNTRLVMASVSSYPQDFGVWDGLVEQAEQRPEFLAAEGMAIERKHFRDIDELLAITAREMIIGGHKVPVANLPHTLASDAAGKLAQSAPFGATYYDRPGGRVFSLRSRGDGAVDVSEIAKRYGGGGHRNAAGFTAAPGWEGEAHITDCAF